MARRRAATPVARASRSAWVMVYQGNATAAVRAALGQLYAYRFFLCRDIEPRLVALFSEPIGHGYVLFLKACGIASVWKDTNSWKGSATATADGLAE
jgi:hypothetical protein